MKVSNLLMLLIIAGGAYYYWHHMRPDDTTPLDAAEEHEQSPPDFSAPFREAASTVPTPTALPKPELIEEFLIEEDIVEKAHAEEEVRLTPQAIRDKLALQRAIDVPHPLTDARTMSGTLYQYASVFRVEPDGIHIRHSEGITKIPLEEMQPEWRTRYHMNHQIALEYRARQAQRDHAAWLAAQERQRLREEQKRQTLHEGHLAAQERREERRQRELEERKQAWDRYDRELAAWRMRNPSTSGTEVHYVRDAYGRYVERRTHRAGTREPQPKPPPYPRP